MRETAELVAHVLGQLRDEDLLTVDVLQTMPLDASRFQPGTMFHPIFEAVRDALVKDHLLPLAQGGYARAGDVKLARGTGLRELLTADQLRQLYPAVTDDQPVSFAHEAITQDRARELWEYMRHELGVDEVTPESLVTRRRASSSERRRTHGPPVSTSSSSRIRPCGDRVTGATAAVQLARSQ